MMAARVARAPLAHTMTTGNALFLTTEGRRSSISLTGTFLAPPAWPSAYSSAPHTSMSTAFSRLTSSTAAEGVSPFAPDLSMGRNSAPPETKARRNRYQFSTMKFTIFLGVSDAAILKCRVSTCLPKGHHAQTLSDPPRRIHLGPVKRLHRRYRCV